MVSRTFAMYSTRATPLVAERNKVTLFPLLVEETGQSTCSKHCQLEQYHLFFRLNYKACIKDENFAFGYCQERITIIRTIKTIQVNLLVEEGMY